MRATPRCPAPPRVASEVLQSRLVDEEAADKRHELVRDRRGEVGERSRAAAEDPSSGAAIPQPSHREPPEIDIRRFRIGDTILVKYGFS